jgi:ATP-dependent Clp protease ATP-binding subunit ClpA
MDIGGRRLTEAAENALAVAREEAARLKAGAVGTEHLLLALGQGALLAALGVAREALEKAVDGAATPHDGPRPRPLPMSANANQALEAAGRAAQMLGADEIDAEHVLLGLLKVGGRAGEALAAAGMPLAEARLRTMEALKVPTEARVELGAPRPTASKAAEELYRSVEEARKERTRPAGTRPLPARDLSAPAEVQPGPLVGRAKELAKLAETVDRPDRPSLFVIGAPGSGRKALVHALARQLLSQAGAGFPRRQVLLFEPALAREVAPPVGGGEGAVVGRWLAEVLARSDAGLFAFSNFVSDEWVYDDFVEFVAPACERRWAQCVFLVTLEERRAIARRFPGLTNVTFELELQPLTREETTEIALARVKSWPKSERVSMANTAAEAGVTLASKFLPGALPGAALEVLERTRERVRRDYAPRVPEMEGSIDDLQRRLKEAVESGRTEEAVRLRRERDSILRSYDEKVEALWEERGTIIVGTGEIVKTVAEMAGKSEDEVRHAGAWH